MGDWGVAALVCAIGFFHLFAWYWNARRHAVGLDGVSLFFERAEWYPPGGWWFWALLMIIGVVLLVLSALPYHQSEDKARGKL